MYGNGCLISDGNHEVIYKHKGIGCLKECPDKKCLLYRRLYIYLEYDGYSDITEEDLKEMTKHVGLYYHRPITLNDSYIKLLIAGNQTRSKSNSLKFDSARNRSISFNINDNSSTESTGSTQSSSETSPSSSIIAKDGYSSDGSISSSIIVNNGYSSDVSTSEIESESYNKRKIPKLKLQYSPKINTIKPKSPLANSSVNLTNIPKKSSKDLVSSPLSTPASSRNNTPTCSPRDSPKDKNGLMQKIFSSKDKNQKEIKTLKEENAKLRQELDELKNLVHTLIKK